MKCLTFRCYLKLHLLFASGMQKFQPVRTKCQWHLPHSRQTFILPSILSISHQWPAMMRHLHTDLVMTSGVQMNLKFGLVTFLTLRRQRDINRGRAAGNS